jgi:MFS family permease
VYLQRFIRDGYWMKGGVQPSRKIVCCTDFMERKPTPLSRNKDYMLLWSGQIVSAVGSETSLIALPLLVLALTNSPVHAGLIGAVRLIPYVLLSLPAGALIDRWNRKRLMILCDTGRLIALGSVPVAFLFGAPSLLQLYLVSLVEGTLYVFFDIAQVASLPNVVEKEQLPAASAQNMITFSTSLLLGPFLGGLLYGIKQFMPFLADAITYAVSVVSLSFIKRRFQQERTNTQSRLLADIRAGLAWLRGQPLILFLAFLAISSQLVGSSTRLAVIVDAEQFPSTTPFLIGMIFLLGGIGGITGSIFGSVLQKRFRLWSIIVVSQLVIIVFWIFYVFAQHAIFLGLISIFVYGGFGAYNVVQFSYRLALIPDHLQGRVNSIFRLIATTGSPLGLLLAGLLLEKIGITPTILFGWGFLIIVMLLALVNPYVRKAPLISQLPAKKAEKTEEIQEIALAEAEASLTQAGLAEAETEALLIPVGESSERPASEANLPEA